MAEQDPTYQLTDHERRLNDLETLTNQLTQTSRYAVDQRSRAGSIPRRIGGLRAVANVKTITWAWDAAAVEDLKHYIVEVADNETMAGFTSYEVGDTTFTYQDGASDTIYYARVKAYTKSKKTGPASNVVSNTTGKIVTADITAGAVGSTQIATGSTYNFSIVTGSPAQTVDTAGYVEITGCRVSLTLPSARDGVRINTFLQGTGVSGATPTTAENLLYTRVERGAGASPSSWTTVITLGPTFIPTDGQAVGASGSLTDVPGVAAIYTYRVLAYFGNPNAGASVVIDTFNLIGEVFLV